MTRGSHPHSRANLNNGLVGDIESRFFSKVVENGDCWQWTAATNGAGYGSLSLGRRAAGRVLAHRWSWEFFRGEIPEGLVLDHLCRNTRCVNPWHLDPVTSAENTRRGAAHRRAAVAA